MSMKVFTISWIIVILFLLIFLAYNKLKSKETHGQSSKKNKAVAKVKTKAKHGEIKEYYPNGKLHYIANWKNGIQYGPIESYDKQGNLIKKSNVFNGKYQGEQIEYYPSGAIKIFAEDYIATVSLHTDISITIPIKLIRNNVAAPEPIIDDDMITEPAVEISESE